MLPPEARLNSSQCTPIGETTVDTQAIQTLWNQMQGTGSAIQTGIFLMALPQLVSLGSKLLSDCGGLFGHPWSSIYDTPAEGFAVGAVVGLLSYAIGKMSISLYNFTEDTNEPIFTRSDIIMGPLLVIGSGALGAGIGPALAQVQITYPCPNLPQLLHPPLP